MLLSQHTRERDLDSRVVNNSIAAVATGDEQKANSSAKRETRDIDAIKGMTLIRDLPLWSPTLLSLETAPKRLCCQI